VLGVWSLRFDQAKEMKVLEAESSRLNRLVAEQALGEAETPPAQASPDRVAINLRARVLETPKALCQSLRCRSASSVTGRSTSVGARI
jgi:hypothetical protein